MLLSAGRISAPVNEKTAIFDLEGKILARG